MNDWNPSPEFEEKVRKATATPNANPEFVNKLRNELARRPVKVKSRFILKPAWALTFALLALALGGAAYALGIALGYIPGLGLVENPAGMRVLEEPVSVTRDGVTFTIKQLLVYSDHIQMVYETSGIAPENYSLYAPDGNTSPKSFCGGVDVGEYASKDPNPALHLPDGTLIERMEGYDDRYPENVYGNMPVYIASIPPEVTEVTVTLKCIYGARLGAAPENWEVRLELKYVPAGTTFGEPVLDVTPSENSSASDNGVTITLDRVVPQDGKYLFYLSAVTDDKQKPTSQTYAAVAYISDATGQKATLTDMRPPSITETDSSWELQPLSPLAYGPYKLVVKKIFLYYKPDNVSFEFDPGQNPQVGQVWSLDQTLSLGGLDVKAVSAKMVEKDLTAWGMSSTTQGIEFAFESVDGKTLIHQIDIMDNDAGHNMNGMIAPDSDYGEPSTKILVRLFYEKGIPTDKIPVTVYKASTAISGRWEIEWSAPEQTGVNLLDAANSIASNSNETGVTAELKRVVQLEEGYLFYVKMDLPEQNTDLRVIEPMNVFVVDSSGKKTSLHLDAPQSFFARKDNLWQFSTKEALAEGPLKIVVEKAKAHYSNSNFDYFESAPSAETLERIAQEYSFTLDVGAEPQAGQTWTLNEEFELGGYHGVVTFARAVEVDSKQLPFPELQPDASINRGYEFTIQSVDPSISWNVGMSIDRPGGNTPENFVDCIGGMDGDFAPTTTRTVACRGLFNGVLRVTFNEITVLLDDLWEMDWTLPAR